MDLTKFLSIWYELEATFLCRSLNYATGCPSLDDRAALDTGLQHTQNGLSLSNTSDDVGTPIFGRRICNYRHSMYDGTIGGTRNLLDYTAWGYNTLWTSGRDVQYFFLVSWISDTDLDMGFRSYYILSIMNAVGISGHMISSILVDVP
jgi:hypothetical protein